MRKTELFAFTIFVLICGTLFHPLCAMDVKEKLQEADEIYSTGDHPEKALELYAFVIADGTDNVSVILSKLKTAYIYDEQLMQYDKAIEAYNRFIADYPENRLSQIVRSKVEMLDGLQKAGEIDVYREFKILEKNIKKRSQQDAYSFKELKRDAVHLSNFAQINHTKSFAGEMYFLALSNLTVQKLYFKTYMLLRFIEKHNPDHLKNNDYSLIKLGILSGAMLMTAQIVIGLCVLFVLAGRGFKRSWITVKQSWKRLLISSTILFGYMIGYCIYVMKRLPDAYMSTTYLYYALIECAILIPFSILLYNSFPYIKEGRLKSIMIWILCALLGLSGWVIFANRFGFILEMLSETL